MTSHSTAGDAQTETTRAHASVAPQPGTTPETPRTDPMAREADHVLGPATAPVTLLMYGDYECPYTRKARPEIERLRQELGEDLRYVFRNFPLTEIHPHAQNAAEAAEAAAGQGRFWEMHEKLFANQKQLGAADLVRYAGELGLDTRRVGSDLADHAYAESVRRDMREGLTSGVRGTPTFFVNGVRHEGNYDFGSLLAAVEGARAAVEDQTEAARAEQILEFWFGGANQDGYAEPHEAWFEKDAGFDRQIRTRFLADHERATAGDLDHWKEAARNSLALILLLDQFPRNLFRGDPRSFATDARALSTAEHSVERGFDREVPKVWRWFFYLPFEHSERLEDQHRSVELFRALGDDPDSAYAHSYAVRHLEVIERFGRFPHRNAVLGRPSTPEEEEFLKEPGAAF